MARPSNPTPFSKLAPQRIKNVTTKFHNVSFKKAKINTFVKYEYDLYLYYPITFTKKEVVSTEKTFKLNSKVGVEDLHLRAILKLITIT